MRRRAQYLSKHERRTIDDPIAPTIGAIPERRHRSNWTSSHTTHVRPSPMLDDHRHSISYLLAYGESIVSAVPYRHPHPSSFIKTPTSFHSFPFISYALKLVQSQIDIPKISRHLNMHSPHILLLTHLTTTSAQSTNLQPGDTCIQTCLTKPYCINPSTLLLQASCLDCFQAHSLPQPHTSNDNYWNMVCSAVATNVNSIMDGMRFVLKLEFMVASYVELFVLSHPPLHVHTLLYVYRRGWGILSMCGSVC